MEIRPITDRELETFRRHLSLVFGDEYDPAREELFRRVMPLERTLAAFVPDPAGQTRMVGTAGDYPLTLTVPGGAQLAMGGTTLITVNQTHRRQGVLSAMMRRHLDDVQARGDALAGLWASEAAIYGRFGYGLATEMEELKWDTRLVELQPGPDELVVEFVDGDVLGETVAPLWSNAGCRRPGAIDRDLPVWMNVAASGARPVNGTSARHIVVRRRDGAGPVLGYASYRQEQIFDQQRPEGQLKVGWVVAEDRDAYRTLWWFLTHIDLFPKVSQAQAAVAEPLLLDASDLRHISRTRLDSMYLRILDVRVALAARTYAADGTLVLQVKDAMGYCDGTYRLTVTDGVAAVETATDEADVSLDVRELGSLYLGGLQARQLWRAGRIDGDEERVMHLGRMFVTDEPPYCTEDF